TPVVDSAQANPVVITTPTPSEQVQDAPAQTEAIGEEAPAAPDLATAVAGPVVITTPGLATPTRRPTPVFVVPTSTPGEPQVIVVTATPTPVYPEPTVVFRSAHQALTPDGCTTLSWEVEHVQAVFLDNQPVVGKGEQRECLRTESETHTLSVLQLDGVQKDYTVTIELMLYTPTPTPTFSPTPVLTPTPTWTPVG